jgi:hypothetical protein
MKSLKFTCLVTLLALMAGTCLASDQQTASAFERFKKLAGAWEATTTDGKKAHMNYELIANGSAVVERYFREDEKSNQMETVYHLDGKDLVLEHYCMAGNQPRMRAGSYRPQTGEIQFDFVSADNLRSPAAGHMHSAKFHFLDDDHFTTEWQFVENGKPKFTEQVAFHRVQ